MKNRVAAVVLCIVVLALALPLDRVALAGDEVAEQLIALEKAAWDAWAKGDMTFFEKHLHENAINVANGEAALGKKAIIKGMTEGACQVGSFQFEDVKAQHVDKDTVVLAYKAKQDATCGGEKMAPYVLATSLWVREGDHWLNANYHETSIGD
jgi:hypothetical protein